MPILQLQNIQVTFGHPPLLEGIDLTIEPGERLCLLGRNGSGKTTLLKIIKGIHEPDQGHLIQPQYITKAWLPQEVPQNLDGHVHEIVMQGLTDAASTSPGQKHKAAAIDDILDDHQEAPWQKEQKVKTILSRMHLCGDHLFASLSAGLKRRVLLARALVREPDLLLLDEPTNHLDINSIKQIENELMQFRGTLLFVTHDRMFMQRLATRMIELDMGRLASWPCGYQDYLKRKQAELEVETRQQALFDKKLAGEEKWIRQGIKARRTRNEGRVRALMKLRAEKKARRKREPIAQITAQQFEMSGKIVIRAKDISYQYEGTTYIDHFSVTILRGDKIGIIGPNGSGKTTLLNLLLNRLSLQSGTVEHGTHLKPAYFDQLRAQLDENKSVADNIAEGNDRITFNGHTRHIVSYLKDFLFTPDRARSPVRMLSGGERNRLLLARLFAKPSNLLILDEPTNDLDAETLELLEDLLFNYSGTILLVSHDRAFLNNVVTSILAFEESGKIDECIGGYDDWQSQSQKEKTPVEKKKTPAPKQVKGKPPQKLGYKEQRELEALPTLIDQLEKEQEELYTAMSDPALYQKNPQVVSGMQDRLKEVEKELETSYARWEMLEARQEALSNRLEGL